MVWVTREIATRLGLFDFLGRSFFFKFALSRAQLVGKGSVVGLKEFFTIFFAAAFYVSEHPPPNRGFFSCNPFVNIYDIYEITNTFFSFPYAHTYASRYGSWLRTQSLPPSPIKKEEKRTRQRKHYSFPDILVEPLGRGLSAM